MSSWRRTSTRTRRGGHEWTDDSAADSWRQRLRLDGGPRHLVWFLTGKYRRGSATQGARGGAVQKCLNGYGLGVLRAVEAVAAASNAAPAQVALAWLAAQPAVAAPIASATRVSQVEELVGAMSLMLTPEQLRTLDRASRPEPAVIK